MVNDGPGIVIQHTPPFKNPILLMGFDGWGNALDISKGMVDYLIRRLKGRFFARLDPEIFYRYDESRPTVRIVEGLLEEFSPPGGHFYAVHTGEEENDLVLLRANEPNLRWRRFAEEVFGLCGSLGVTLVITLGSMYDNVLHSDRRISAISSSGVLAERLKALNVQPISYNGPSAVHTIIHQEAVDRGIDSLSLWSHCPFYLENTLHYGLLSRLLDVLSTLCGFVLDREELENQWQTLNGKVEELIQENPKLASMIEDIRKSKEAGSRESIKRMAGRDDKVINLTDFLDPG